MSAISFSLPGLPPSQNSRRHFYVRYKDDQKWKGWARQALIDAINRSGHTDLPWQRVHVRYVFHYPRITNVDPDNLTGRMKPCLDGAKGLAFPDDSTKYVHDLSVGVEVVRKVPAGVTVVISRCVCEEGERGLI